MRGTLLMVAAIGLLVGPGLAGCLGGQTDGGVFDDPSSTELGAASTEAMGASSRAFDHGGGIPATYTCDGENISPPIWVTGLPDEAVTLALIVGDPDAPVPGVGPLNFTHWVLWNAEPLANGSVAFPEDGVPVGASEGENDGGSNGYTGPCPPVPLGPHRYYFTFYAVDTTLELDQGATREELASALDGHVMDTTVLTGLYGDGPLPPVVHAPLDDGGLT